MELISKIIQDHYGPSKTVKVQTFRLPRNKENFTPIDKIFSAIQESLIAGCRDDNYQNFLKSNNISGYNEDFDTQTLLQFGECYSQNLRKLSRYGWFVELEGYLPEILEMEVKEENRTNINAVLTNYYEEHFDRIIKELYKRHPQRINFIEESIFVYKSGAIRHAILGVLTQIDGICYDRFRKSFFKKRNVNKMWVPVIVNELLEEKDNFLELFLSPFLENCPISVHYSQVELHQGKLNRHTSIHGMDLTYGGKENFLKCLSLFKYVSDIIHEFDRGRLEMFYIMQL